MPPALEFVDFHLALRTPGRERMLFEGASLQVPAGRLYLLAGESGSGKSTLLRLCTGLIEPDEPAPRTRGALYVLGEDVTHGVPAALRGRVTAVLQEEGLLDELSPRENVVLALRAAGRSRRLALGLLSQAGLEHPPEQVSALSGGMRKRVAIARALAAEPELIIFDEPTAGLDPRSARQIAELLLQMQRDAQDRRTTIVITHDLDAFAGLCDGVLQIEGEKLQLLPAAAAAAPLSDRRGGERFVDGGDDEAIHGLKKLLLGTAAWTQTCCEAVLRLPPVFPGLALREAVRFSIGPLPFVLLAAAAIGGLATFFALRNTPLEGALTAQVLTGVGKVATSVLVPLLAAVFFAARMGAGAAARIGTMRRTNQTHALTLLGVRPADYLLTPLVWAMALAMPVVVLASVVVAALCSLVAARAVAGTTAIGWAEAFFRTVERADLRFVVGKSILSGAVVAVLTYHLAMIPKRSGRDVGDAVNSAIVSGLCAVLLVHAALTLVQFA